MKWAIVMSVIFFSTDNPLWAQDLVFKSSSATVSLVELYSSEGCSSCPPAEAWTNNLRNAPGLWKDIFPIAFHVDYWDGLGWPDRFARPEYTQRQRDYAALLGQDSVYTPEFIVNGHEWRRNWLDGQNIPSAGAQKDGTLTLTITGKGKKLMALYVPEAGTPAEALMLHVVLLGFNLVTDVQAGENNGSRLEHDFVALGLSSTPLSSNAGKSFQSETVELKSFTEDLPGAVVAWVSGNDGAILQVAGGWLPVAEKK